MYASGKFFFKLLRPHQWFKNLILFFPPFLGGVLFNERLWRAGVEPFLVFCMVSSATYIVNDIRDCERDRLHPQKCRRPLASGVLGVPVAVAAVGLLLAVAGGLTLRQPPLFAIWLLAYLLLSLAYSFGLKDWPVFDVFCIASGFVFRLFAGGAVFGVRISDWLFLSVLLLALFLGCGKRLAEQKLLGVESASHRKALDGYPPGALAGMMEISGAAVLVTYTLYVIAMHRLVYTVPLCCFGLFRYILLVKRGQSGDPTDSLLKDPVLFLVGLIWIVIVGVGTYLG